MKLFTIKNLLIAAIICCAAIGMAIFALLSSQKKEPVKEPAKPEQKIEEPAKIAEPEIAKHKIIGYSAQNRPIESHTFGTGEKLLVFVGGIHGGYEWNSSLLAWEFIDYFEKNPKSIPENLSVAIIPALNPDGLAKITGKDGRFTIADIPEGNNETGRFNANNVDLNRNFDCNWQPKGLWRQKEVSAGTAPFSEPESKAIRDFVLQNNPAAVLFWHSQSNAVYGSMCNNDMMPETRVILNAYANVSGYAAVDTFDNYQITGDATDWLASINVPAISVELSTHNTIEWTKNLAGITALFNYYKNK